MVCHWTIYWHAEIWIKGKKHLLLLRKMVHSFCFGNLSISGCCFALCPERPFCGCCCWGRSFRDAKPFFLQMTKKGGGNPIPVNGVPTVRAHWAKPEQQLACALEHGPTLPSSFHKGFVHFCFLVTFVLVLTQLCPASVGESRSCSIDFCSETQNCLKWSQH